MGSVLGPTGKDLPSGGGEGEGEGGAAGVTSNDKVRHHLHIF